MRGLFIVGAALALWACHEHKPRPVTDCGDSCTDAGGLDAGIVDDDDAGDADAGDADAGDADADPEEEADAEAGAA